MTKTTINFKYKGKRARWKFWHNLGEFGTSLDAAFVNYTARTFGEPNQDDFIGYVVSKDPLNFKCEKL